MSFTPITVAQLNTQVQNALANSYPEGQPDKWDLSSITDWYSTNPLPFTLEQLKDIGMTPGQMKAVWSQMGKDIDGEIANDLSGNSVSLSSDGTIMAIGADYNDGNGTDSGHVRVYEYTNGSWVQKGDDIDGEAAGDRSGWSVSLSSDGKIVAIGAYRNDGNSGNSGDNRGHVRVYEWNGTAWVQKGGEIDGEATSDYSGVSVSLSSDGTIVAIGAPYNSTNGIYSGHVRVFKWKEFTGGNYHYSNQIQDSGQQLPLIITPNNVAPTNGDSYWTQLGDDIDGETVGDNSGISVSLSGNGDIVAIGARFNSENGSNSGHVRVYKYDTDSSSWVQKGGDIDGEAANDWSGRQVSLSSDGSIVAIGARYNDGNGSNSGHVRVFEWNGSWVQKGGDIDGEAGGDRSGWSVSLSSDGKIVAIGAYLNDDNGSNSGHVRVYQYTNDSWSQLGGDIDGEAGGDYSGSSVSLSSDGTIVAIGAPYNDGNGISSGHVRVFDLSNGYSLTNFKDAGFDATSLQTASYTIGDLQSVGYSDNQIVGAGYSASLLRNYGYNASQLNNGDYTVSQLISGGYTLGQLVYAGYTYSKLIAAGFTGAEIKDSWIQLGGDLDGEAADDQSGRSVSLSSDGTIVAIGTWGNDDNGPNSGHVRVYEWKTNIDNNTSSWVQKGGDIDGEADYDWSGYSVSLSSDGTIVAIGAPYNDTNGNASGHVRVFKWKEFTGENYILINQTQNNDQQLPLIITSKDDNGDYNAPTNGNSYWTQLGIDIDGDDETDYLGWSVSLSSNGTIVAIGAYGNDGTNGSNSGHVRVYQYDTNTSSWSQMGQDIDGEAAGDNSGRSVSLSSDGYTVAIDAIYNDGNGSDSGHVRVYQYDGTEWVQKGEDIDGEADYDWSGYSVSLSSDGTIVAIGAPYNDGNTGDATDNRGHVRVFKWKEFTGGNYILINQTQNNDQQLPLIITSKDENGDYIAPIPNNYYWTQLGIDIDGETAGDQSGYSVSLSSDGTIVAIGAYGNDGNGTDSGHVRVYEWKTNVDTNTSSWVQMGSDIDGEADGDNSGWSVSLSSDGLTVAIGATGNDGNGSNSGHVRVYKYGISARELKAIGTPARDLIRLYNNSEILEAGYTIEQLTVPLFSASELLAAGNTLTDLKNGGTNAAELHEVGYSFGQLRLAGFSAVDCRNANMSNSEIVASGFSIRQLREGGFSAKRLKNAGYNARELYENDYPVADLFKADYSASEIRLAGVDALQARFGGIKTGEMKLAGYTVEEYKAASYKASRMKEAGYTREELEGVYSKEELDAAGL